MKKLFTVLVIVVPVWVFAQIPVGLNYQAIAWDKDNVAMANRNIEVMFEILQGTPGSGSVITEFDEIHNVTTNAAGLFTLIIGSKNTERFAKIDWAKTPKYLRVTIDKVVSPLTPMLSVPYAQYAERTNLKAGTGISVEGNTITNAGDADNDPQNEIQTLTSTDKILSLSKGGGEVNIPITNTSAKFTGLLAISKQTPLRSSVAFTAPNDGTYLILLEYKIGNSANEEASPVIKVSGSMAGTIISDNLIYLGTDFKEQTRYGNHFNLANLKKDETVTIQLEHPSPASKGSISVIMSIEKFVFIRVE